MEKYRETDDYKQSVERSKPGGPDHLTKKLDRAKWIDDWIKEDWDNWYGLTESDKTLWQQRRSGQLEEQLNEIRQSAPPDKYLGAVETMARRAA